MAAWSTVAVPSILFGCDYIPFSLDAIQAVNRVQSQVGKIILGLPVRAPNLCAQTELGFRPFKFLLSEMQLKSYLRLLHLPDSRLASVALQEHTRGGWESPYYSYLFSVRSEVNLLNLPAVPRSVSYTHLTLPTICSV